MSGYNKTILLGNLTRDVELKYSPKGTAIAKIGLALNRSWRGEDGQKREETTFVDVDAFGKQAETIAKYCSKGSALHIEGRLKMDQWEDRQTGQKRQKLGVVLEGFTFVGGGNNQGRPAQRQAEPEPEAGKSSPIDDDDVPF